MSDIREDMAQQAELIEMIDGFPIYSNDSGEEGEADEQG